MADENEGNPKELPLPHVEASGFRTVFANGALFSSPPDSSKSWMLTFYSEGVRIVSETLEAADTEGTWRHFSPPRIETQRIRRDEVCVIIPENQLEGLFNALAAAMKRKDQ
jgi:hypothetical protein